MAAVTYQSVSKSFDQTRVIEEFDLEIEEGAFVAYVGPSGCGKTTLLRLLAGLEEVSAGHMTIGGRDVTGTSPKARNVAMIFQNYALYPHMTVAENIGFGLKVRGIPRAERDRYVHATAGMLELGELLERKPRELSGGQRQRVAMGRAVVRDPDVFLMDEPLSNLDAQLRGQMRSEIKALQRRLGATMIYVTHDQVEAMTMSDQIVVLREGRVQQVGTPETLFARPANRFVAGFIGAPAMNILPLVRCDGEGVRMDRGSTLNAGFVPDQAIEIGVRPQDLRLLHSIQDAPIAWEEVVALVEPLGGETHVHLGADGARVVICHPGPPRTEPGKRVCVGFAPGDAHFFDCNGAAIA